MPLVNIDKAIRLPAPDVEALIQGRMIAAIVWRTFNPGEQYALYPTDNSNMSLIKPKQMSLFSESGQLELPLVVLDKVSIKAWARCEFCQTLNDSESLEALSRLTVWTTEALQQILQQRPFIFVAYLRVYLLPQPLEISMQSSGNFVSLPKSLTVIDATPVLSDNIFAKRRKQLEKLEPPEHPELEELQSALVHLSTTNPKAKQLDAEIKMFLGWSENSPTAKPDPDLGWIKTISQIGNSSDGNTFEKLVRKSLIELGFGNSNRKPEASLDPESTGGAGGLDFYCETPYQVVGECKATKSETVADGTPAQLIKLGHKHLQEQYNCCIKIIMAAGQLNRHANKTAIGNHMNVIRPETLQRLVELKAKHPGSVNLLELKPCLEQEPFGQDADVKVNRYIERVWDKIKVRSHIVQLVKDFLERTKSTSVEFNQLHGAYAFSMSPQPLKYEEMHQILIELSSPLTGYLGRIKGEDLGRDRFYFLRDLQLDD
ncbi:DUF1802 family protein [Tychonema sp. LEGE 07203]|uniref:DUF1802 family protein n=1 Tax=Tychonema sp. LEGE 07203 TaxID=1828671 RepID=UPI00187E2A4C|nr:DUF1802 family protein [Tychonema sp. LEGE 07203]MBE9097086.1 DUF1802 family protein [Tychonema sp. LEGE 07203]